MQTIDLTAVLTEEYFSQKLQLRDMSWCLFETPRIFLCFKPLLSMTTVKVKNICAVKRRITILRQCAVFLTAYTQPSFILINSKGKPDRTVQTVSSSILISPPISGNSSVWSEGPTELPLKTLLIYWHSFLHLPTATLKMLWQKPASSFSVLQFNVGIFGPPGHQAR